jgi:CRP/FNR family transcriptional regulator, polysaccharide utilization system transcription regulator
MLKSTQGKNCSQCLLHCVLQGSFEESEKNRHLREIVFRKGETIYKQGLFGSKIIFIQEGLVKLFVEGTGNKNLIVRLYTGNSYIGFNQLYGSNESKYTVVALKDTRVCIVDINYFKKISLCNNGLAESIFKLIVAENDFMFDCLKFIGTKSLIGRLAYVLLYLSEDDFNREDIYNYITRKDIAELSAMSVESLERLLGDLKKDKIINIKGKRVEILNLKLVHALSRTG